MLHPWLCAIGKDIGIINVTFIEEISKNKIASDTALELE
jgi:hypothetical protein